jgi:hypothetical protein
MAEHEDTAQDEGEPTAEPSPVTPDDEEPTEQDAKEALPGVPEEAQGEDD